MPKTKHGMHGTKENQAWRDMKDRCKNPRNRSYKNYGGRGISVCSAWESFEQFFADLGPAPPGSWLERNDNNGNYCKDNCRWASRDEQQNNRRGIIKLEFQGREMSVAQWARETGIQKQTLYERLRLGWPIERALTTPCDRYGNRKESGRLRAIKQ